RVSTPLPVKRFSRPSPLRVCGIGRIAGRRKTAAPEWQAVPRHRGPAGASRCSFEEAGFACPCCGMLLPILERRRKSNLRLVECATYSARSSRLTAPFSTVYRNRPGAMETCPSIVLRTAAFAQMHRVCYTCSMPDFAAPVERLIDELKHLPGIGQKTAQRLAYQLL